MAKMNLGNFVIENLLVLKTPNSTVRKIKPKTFLMRKYVFKMVNSRLAYLGREIGKNLGIKLGRYKEAIRQPH